MSKVAQLFTNAGVDNAGLIAEIEQLLTSAETEKSGMIPKSRFNEVLKVRDDLRADVEELNVKISSLETKLTDSKEKLVQAKTVETELAEFKQKAFKEKRDIWVEKSKMFNVAEDDKKYPDIQKIKDDFVFSENPDDYTETQIVQNLSLLKPYEKIGYFGDNYTPPDIDDKRSQGGGDKTKVVDPLFQLPE